MRLAVLDTNVIVSAGINPDGAPMTLLEDWALMRRIGIITCPSILDEYYDVVQRHKFAAYDFPPLWLEPLIETSLQLPDPAPWPHSIPDPNDAPLLALAHSTGAWLITGNLKHFPDKSRGGVTVLSPAEYLAHLDHGSREP